MAWAAERRSAEVYAALDHSDGFYRPAVQGVHRSHINPCFHLPDPALTAGFIARARAAGLSDLQGHPEVGGIRVSLYNGTPDAAVASLLEVMDGFRHAHA
jgi:phosphoserine aminotransferase